MGKTVFDILNSGYATLTGYQALPFIPAELLARKTRPGTKAFDKGEFADKEIQSVNGSLLRKYKGGVYYFMPVVFEHAGKSWNFDDAIVSVTGRKTIVKTPLTGRQGAVKELISIDDYEIKLIAVLEGEDYPEQDIMDMVKLWEINENVKMACAITDYFLKDEDMVVIEKLDFPSVEGVEDLQIVAMTLSSDQNFELDLN